MVVRQSVQYTVLTDSQSPTTGDEQHDHVTADVEDPSAPQSERSFEINAGGSAKDAATVIFRHK